MVGAAMDMTVVVVPRRASTQKNGPGSSKLRVATSEYSKDVCKKKKENSRKGASVQCTQPLLLIKTPFVVTAAIARFSRSSTRAFRA